MVSWKEDLSVPTHVCLTVQCLSGLGAPDIVLCICSNFYARTQDNESLVQTYPHVFTERSSVYSFCQFRLTALNVFLFFFWCPESVWESATCCLGDISLLVLDLLQSVTGITMEGQWSTCLTIYKTASSATYLMVLKKMNAHVVKEKSTSTFFQIQYILWYRSCYLQFFQKD